MWIDYKSLNHIEHQNDEAVTRYGVRAAFGPIFITL